MAGFTLKKREFFRHVGTISMFAVVGTIISTITFGLLTYLLVLLHVVNRKHLGTAPLIECMLYGDHQDLRFPFPNILIFVSSVLPVPRFPLFLSLRASFSVLWRSRQLLVSRVFPVCMWEILWGRLRM